MRTDLVATLRDHDLQVTAQRLAVLRAVTTHPHGTANEIADHVRSEIGAISRQSVHDTLTVLTERRIVRRIQPAGSSARFEERLADHPHHHHLVCRSCDRLVDVHPDVVPVAIPAPAESEGFVVDDAEVLLWGVCPACQSHPPSTDTSVTPEAPEES